MFGYTRARSIVFVRMRLPNFHSPKVLIATRPGSRQRSDQAGNIKSAKGKRSGSIAQEMHSGIGRAEG
jgi:hypothetical protein